jgi:hypothetical protein
MQRLKRIVSIIAVLLLGATSFRYASEVLAERRAFRARYAADSVAAVGQSLQMIVAPLPSSLIGQIRYRCRVDSLGSKYASRSMEYQINISGIDTLPLIAPRADEYVQYGSTGPFAGPTAATQLLESTQRSLYEAQRNARLAEVVAARIALSDTQRFQVLSIPITLRDLTQNLARGSTTFSVQGSYPFCPVLNHTVSSSELYWSLR